MDEAGDDRRTVLVELDVPPLQASTATPPGSDRGTRTVIGPDDALVEKRRAELEAHLRAEGLDPHWLQSSRVFVVEVTREQLRRILALPGRSVVQPNRRRP